MRDRQVDPVLVARQVRASYATDLGAVGAFLPARVPLDDLPPVFERHLMACKELAYRYPAERGGVRRWMDREFSREEVATRYAIPRLTCSEHEKLMTVLAVLGHAYRWDFLPPARHRFNERHIALPPGIEGPWNALSRVCGQPRVGTTWTLHLCNWTMKDRSGGARYRAEDLYEDNIRIAHNWLLPPADVHLDRFSTSFVLVEARGAAVLRHMVDTVDAIASRRMEEVLASLEHLHAAIRAMTIAFSLNVRKRTVDTAIWRELVQPTFPWSAEADEPGQMEAGPSGLQMGTVQALDAALGVEGNSELGSLAKTARRYMPEPHRRFLGTLDLAGPVIRSFVRESGCKDLRMHFNRCVAALRSFRATHQARGCQYLRTRPNDGGARASTGLTIGVGDDPIETFERTMAERRTGDGRRQPHVVLLTDAGTSVVRGRAGRAPTCVEAGFLSTGLRCRRS